MFFITPQQAILKIPYCINYSTLFHMKIKQGLYAGGGERLLEAINLPTECA
jgi:hypothetical protein